MGDRRAGARRLRRRHRPRHRHPRRPRREVRRPVAAARAWTSPTGKGRSPPSSRPTSGSAASTSSSTTRATATSARSRSCPRPTSATSWRPTSSARCGSRRRRCRILRAQGAGTSCRCPRSAASRRSAASAPTTRPSGRWKGLSQALAQEVAPFGIHVTLIEPGGFATDWAGPSAKHSTPLPAYDAYREEVQRMRRERNPKPGDPVASGQAVLAVVDAEEPPLRVFFGDGPLAIGHRRLRSAARDVAAVGAGVDRRGRRGTADAKLTGCAPPPPSRRSRPGALDLALEAERLGLDVCWVAEAWGADAPTALGWLAGRTRRMLLGSGVIQVGTRTPGRGRPGRAHAGRAVRRPVPARARRVRPAGDRGPARGGVRPAAHEAARDRRGRADGAGG